MDTWQDSWFEEGMRVIYILPQRQVDAVLPLTIRPAPVETTRAFVGRIEMVSPAIKQDFKDVVASGDGAGLKKYGRFLEVFAQQALQAPFSSKAYGQAASVRSSFEACVPYAAEFSRSTRGTKLLTPIQEGAFPDGLPLPGGRNGMVRRSQEPQPKGENGAAAVKTFERDHYREYNRNLSYPW
jgi:hypothetical protein